MARVDDVITKERIHNSASFLDIIEESKDPNLHYRWVRVDENMMSNTKHKILGYTPVPRGAVRTISEPLEKGEDNIIVGDLMLMSCPKEEYERRQLAKQQRMQSLFDSTTREVEEAAAKKGFKLIRDNDHAKETQ